MHISGMISSPALVCSILSSFSAEKDYARFLKTSINDFRIMKNISILRMHIIK